MATNDTKGGLDPVAKIEETGGDMYAVADHLAEHITTDHVFVNVVHGDMYLATWRERDDAYWRVDGEITDGLTGDAWGASDDLTEGLPDDTEIVDVMGGGRYFVSQQSE